MSPFINLSAGSVRWQIDRQLVSGDARGAAAELFAPDGPPVESWMRTGQAHVVKHGPHQSVYRVQLPGLDLHLKHYHPADTRAWLRSWLRPAKARLEFQRTCTAGARGLPTLVPLAVGRVFANHWSSSSYLVTQTLPGAVPLNRFLEGTLPSLEPVRGASIRQRIAVALGRLLAHMHHAGLMYRDLHPGNLLVQLDAADCPRLVLIDLYDVAFGPPLSPRQRHDNLVILNRWFVLRAQRSDRLRCWQAYQAALSGLATAQTAPSATMWRRILHPFKRATESLTQGVLVRELEKQTVTSNAQFWRNLERRCLKSNRHFRCVRLGDIVGHAVTDLDPALLDRLLRDPDEPFRCEFATRLKDSRSATVVELQPTTGCGRPLVFKRFAVTHWHDPLVSLLRPTPALRSFAQGYGLALRRLPTPRPLAVLHRQRHGMRREGYLLTEKVEDAVNLRSFVNRLVQTRAVGSRLLLRRLIAEVAQLVRILHQRHVSHRDLKAANLLVQQASATGAFHIWLIDLVGVSRQRRLRRGRRLQNLVRLHASFHADPYVTRTDKLRFLRVYLRWGLRGKLGWKAWWRAIERATQAKIARNLRKGRPLG
jgi:serine/threonine protein kinase